MSAASGLLGVAVIGAGAVTEKRHLSGMAKSGEVEARSIFDPDRDRAARIAEDFAIPCVAESLEEAIQADGVDAALIASPNAYHREGTEAALAAGKHVLCEKPIALTLAEARSMERAATDAGLTLMLGFHHRFSSEHDCVKRLLDAGVLGDPRAFHSLISEPIDVVPGGVENYRFSGEAGGGLTLIDVGSHRIDEMRDLLGEVDEVYAEMGSVLANHDLDDSVVLSVKTRSGALGAMAWHRFSRSYLSPCTLLGTKATMNFAAAIVNPYQSAPVSIYVEDAPERVLPAHVLPWMRPERWWGESRPGWVQLYPPRVDTFEAEWQAFARSVRAGATPNPGALDGYRALEVVLAAYLSLAEHRPVKLPLDADQEIPRPRF